MSSPVPTFRFSERVTATTVLVFIALIGVLLGVALDRTVLLPRMLHGLRGRHHGSFGIMPFPEHDLAVPAVQHTRDRLAKALNLTAVQQVQIDSIMARRMAALHQMRYDAEGRVHALLDETRREIDSVLTPTQRQQFQAMHARHELGRHDHEAMHAP